METLSTERKAFYQTLSRKMIFLILIVSFTPMVLTTVILLSRFNLAYHEKVEAHISELVQKHAQNIDAFLMEKLKNIQFLVQTIDTGKIDSMELEHYLKLLKKDYGNVFTDLGMIDDKGLQFAYAGPFKLENAMYDNAQWFIRAKSQAYFISDVFAGLRGHPHFIITVQVQGKQEKYILRATINFGAFNSLVENIQMGKTGIAFIVNREGALQTKTDILIKPSLITSLLNNGREYEGKPLPTNALAAQGKLSGPSSTWPSDYEAPSFKKEKIIFIRQEDPSGHQYLYATAFLRNIDWIMVFRQNTEDAFRALQQTQFLAIVISLLGVIAIISLAFTLPRKIVGIISQADKKSEVMNRQVVESGKLATIGELAAGIAHEINNPVAIMVEEAGWIADLLEDEEEGKCINLKEYSRALKQIDTQGKRCKEITHKLLSFARKTDSTLNDVQINDSIREMVALTSQMARYNNVTIETNLSDDLPYIRISPSELQQVILNLINNAIDAMERTGGILKIDTKISKIETEHIVVTLQDNGPGIPESNLARIFDPFFTTKQVGKGTGLGLSICYGIIQKMGGKIDVQSQVGVGTRFRIWIPFQDKASTGNKNSQCFEKAHKK